MVMFLLTQSMSSMRTSLPGALDPGGRAGCPLVTLFWRLSLGVDVSVCTTDGAWNWTCGMRGGAVGAVRILCWFIWPKESTRGICCGGPCSEVYWWEDRSTPLPRMEDAEPIELTRASICVVARTRRIWWKISMRSRRSVMTNSAFCFGERCGGMSKM
jgi:hypothetical protein